MRVLGVIPARFASTRFAGKMLAPILGKPVFLWTYQGAKSSHLLDHVIIATEDEKIAEVAEHNGADVILTSPTLHNGTERVAEVAKKLHLYDIIVNIQGDEPLIDHTIIDKVVIDLQNHPDAAMSTGYVTENFCEMMQNQNVVKLVTDAAGYALYFSRSPIPHPKSENCTFKRHVGIYAYRWEELIRLSRLPQSMLEREENLEQLRALEAGMHIHCIEIPEAKKLIAVDMPGDIAKVENFLKQS